MASQPNQQRVVVALLNRASTSHRLTILDQLVSNPLSPFELVAERSLRLSLPEDDELLRSLLATEIDTQGEAETLVRWALKFTATTNYFIVLRLKTASEESVCDLFAKDFAPGLWDSYGPDEIYVSPDHATAEMQIDLLFPDSTDKGDADTADTEASKMMMHTASSSSEGGSAFSQASVLSSTSTAATSTVLSTRPQSRASMVHPTSTSAFKARAIPTTVKSRPSIEPRLSRAAALRMGVQLPDSPARSQPRNASPAKDDANRGISGVTKKPVAQPVSLKAPSIAPRLNKAALARQGGGGGVAESTQRPAPVCGQVFPGVDGKPRKQVDFSNTPGHKRLSLAGQSSIASIAPPSIAPRQNRASMSRIQHQQPGSSAAVSSPRSSTAAAPPSAFKAGIVGRHRSSSVASSAATVPAQAAPRSDERGRRPIDFASTPGHKRASLSLSIPSLAAPSVAPRQNRASLARARPSLASGSPRAAPAQLPPTTAASDTSSSSSGKPNAPRRASTAAADYASVPGHKRASLQFSLASLKAPSIMPRLNKAAGARIGAGKAGAQ